MTVAVAMSHEAHDRDQEPGIGQLAARASIAATRALKAGSPSSRYGFGWIASSRSTRYARSDGARSRRRRDGDARRAGGRPGSWARSTRARARPIGAAGADPTRAEQQRSQPTASRRRCELNHILRVSCRRILRARTICAVDRALDSASIASAARSIVSPSATSTARTSSTGRSRLASRSCWARRERRVDATDDGPAPIGQDDPDGPAVGRVRDPTSVATAEHRGEIGRQRRGRHPEHRGQLGRCARPGLEHQAVDRVFGGTDAGAFERPIEIGAQSLADARRRRTTARSVVPGGRAASVGAVSAGGGSGKGPRCRPDKSSGARTLALA